MVTWACFIICCHDGNAAADGTDSDAGMGVGGQDGAMDEPETCEPGEFFELDCNTCECPESGLRSEAPCTELACVDMMVPEPESDMGGGLTVVDADVTDSDFTNTNCVDADFRAAVGLNKATFDARQTCYAKPSQPP